MLDEQEHRWTWELRSLNGRGLDIRTKLPHQFSDMEASLRKLVSKSFGRGSISVNLTYKCEQADAALHIDDEALDRAIRLINRVRVETECDLPRPENILLMPGVMTSAHGEIGPEAVKKLQTAMLASLDQAIAKLSTARRQEGCALAAVLSGLIDKIDDHIKTAKQIEQETLGDIKERLTRQITELQNNMEMEEGRLAQEVAMLSVKADIREELDRLSTHITAARALLDDSEPVGRQLD